MAQNYIESGERLDYTATATITSGQAVLVGSMVGVALGDAAIGEKVVVIFKGVWTLPKAGAQAQALGAKLYWDSTNSVLTTTATSNTFAGYVWKAALAADATVQIVLAQ